MSASAVQIRGAKNVIAAYKSNEAASFAIFCGKDLLTKYQGEDLEEGSEKLGEFVEVIRQAGSGALYQLRQFDEQVKRITNETPWDYSFRFKVCESESEEGGPVYNGLRQEVAELKALVLAQQQMEDEEEDEPQTVGGGIIGMINTVLAKPEIQHMLMQKIGSWFTGVMHPGQPAAAMGSVPMPDVMDASTARMEEALEALPEPDRIKLDQAIRTLIILDPNVATNLSKIAAILQSDPNKYKMFASML